MINTAVEITFQWNVNADFRQSAAGETRRRFKAVEFMIEVARRFLSVAFDSIGCPGIKPLQKNVRQLFPVLKRMRENEQQRFRFVRQNKFKCGVPVMMP